MPWQSPGIALPQPALLEVDMVLLAVVHRWAKCSRAATLSWSTAGQRGSKSQLQSKLPTHLVALLKAVLVLGKVGRGIGKL